jgi:hypothetical protein
MVPGRYYAGGSSEWVRLAAARSDRAACHYLSAAETANNQGFGAIFPIVGEQSSSLQLRFAESAAPVLWFQAEEDAGSSERIDTRAYVFRIRYLTLIAATERRPLSAEGS